MFLFSKVLRPSPRPTQSLIQWVTEVVSLGIRQLETLTDHSPSSTVKIKNISNYIFTSPDAFKAHTQRQFYLYLYVL